MKNKASILIATALLSTLIAPVTKADYSCSGAVTRIGVGYDGGLSLNIGHGVWTLCNVQQDGTYGGVAQTSSACRSWYAMFLSAQLASRPVAIYIVSATVSGTNPPQCASLGNWVSPGVYFVDSTT
jgi:hypothetical protein